MIGEIIIKVFLLCLFGGLIVLGFFVWLFKKDSRIDLLAYDEDYDPGETASRKEVFTPGEDEESQ